MRAFLHFGSADDLPMQTVGVPCREKPLGWQSQGLQLTASGYGRRLPSPYQVLWNGRWRRVYVSQIGNAGTAHIGAPGAWEATVSFEQA